MIINNRKNQYIREKTLVVCGTMARMNSHTVDSKKVKEIYHCQRGWKEKV